MTNFDRAFEVLMINETGSADGGPTGGLVNDPSDNGGETKYGISHAAFPDIDVPNLTLDAAKAFYQTTFWNQYFMDKMPWAVAVVLFDCIVNHGPAEPIQWLQRLLGVTADGIFGKGTMAVLCKVKLPLNLARDLTLARRDYVETLRNYDRFKAGWCRRHLDTLIAAVNAPVDNG